MSSIFEGVRVLEVAEWILVPAASAVLAEWGADVIKVERPIGGDPQRGLAVGGVTPLWNGIALQMEYTNRGGKRSVGIDITTESGRELLLEIAAQSDVFMTSLLPGTLNRLKIDADSVREVNPQIIYANGHGLGTLGPDADKGGYDMSAYWCRGGVGFALSDPQAAPVRMRPAMGDRMAAMNLVAGIASALFKRERTNTPSTVEVSLLGSAVWQLTSDVVYSKALGVENSLVARNSNPLVEYYRTAEGRWLSFALLQSDRWFPEFAAALGASYLLDDDRFSSTASRAKNYAACVQVIADIIGSETLEAWRKRLANFDGPWSPMQSIHEVLRDPQVLDNGYVIDVASASGPAVPIVPSPIKFDGEHGRYDLCPEPGQHTEEILLELGHNWDDLIDYKDRGVIN